MAWAHRLRAARKQQDAPGTRLEYLRRFRIDALEERHEARRTRAGDAG